MGRGTYLGRIQKKKSVTASLWPVYDQPEKTSLRTVYESQRMTDQSSFLHRSSASIIQMGRSIGEDFLTVEHRLANRHHTHREASQTSNSTPPSSYRRPLESKRPRHLSRPSRLFQFFPLHSIYLCLPTVRKHHTQVRKVPRSLEQVHESLRGRESHMRFPRSARVNEIDDPVFAVRDVHGPVKRATWEGVWAEEDVTRVPEDQGQRE